LDDLNNDSVSQHDFISEVVFASKDVDEEVEQIIAVRAAADVENSEMDHSKFSVTGNETGWVLWENETVVVDSTEDWEKTESNNDEHVSAICRTRADDLR